MKLPEKSDQSNNKRQRYSNPGIEVNRSLLSDLFCSLKLNNRREQLTSTGTGDARSIDSCTGTSTSCTSSYLPSWVIQYILYERRPEPSWVLLILSDMTEGVKRPTCTVTYQYGTKVGRRRSPRLEELHSLKNKVTVDCLQCKFFHRIFSSKVYPSIQFMEIHKKPIRKKPSI